MKVALTPRPSPKGRGEWLLPPPKGKGEWLSPPLPPCVAEQTEQASGQRGQGARLGGGSAGGSFKTNKAEANVVDTRGHTAPVGTDLQLDERHARSPSQTELLAKLRGVRALRRDSIVARGVLPM